jgi:hypothetical protein
MPGAASNGFRPERFAALWAGLDTGNGNEAEAVNKFRALRRMAVAENLRIIDAMGRADVVRALDVQLRPVREESHEVKAALEQAVALRQELTERTRNVRELTELLRRQEETSEGLRKELKAVTRQTGQRQQSCASASSTPPRASYVAASAQPDVGFIPLALFVLVLILIVFGTLHLR